MNSDYFIYIQEPLSMRFLIFRFRLPIVPNYIVRLLQLEAGINHCQIHE
jgi:hypothetical protein